MALELTPNQLVGDHIYHEVIGHANGMRIYGRQNLMFTRRMGDNLLFSRFNEAGRLEHLSIPITPGLTFTERTDEDEDVHNRNDTPSSGYVTSESDEEDPDPGPDDIYLHGMAAPAAEAAGRDLIRKSKRKGKSKKRKGMSKKRRSRKSRKMRRRRVTVF